MPAWAASVTTAAIAATDVQYNTWASPRVDKWLRADKGQGLNRARYTKALIGLLQQLAFACTLVILALTRAPLGQTQVAAAHDPFERTTVATMRDASASCSSRGRRSQATTLEQNDPHSRGMLSGDDHAAVPPPEVEVESLRQRCRLLPPFSPGLGSTWNQRVALRAPRARAPPVTLA